MNDRARNLQDMTEEYLLKLRRALRELESADVDDVVRELRSHIQERLASMPLENPETIAGVLRELGDPQHIAALYRTELLAQRARNSFSPLLMMRAALRWAAQGVLGLITYTLGMIGYVLAIGLIVAAVLKPFAPGNVGVWWNVAGEASLRKELLGWWIIPVGIICGPLLLVGTTMLLRWALKFTAHSVPARVT